MQRPGHAATVVDDEIVDFCQGKRAVLLIEEGQPDYIEQNLHSILRKAGVTTALHGKDLLPMGGEYTTQVVTKGLTEFLEAHRPELMASRPVLLLPPENPASPFAPHIFSGDADGNLLALGIHSEVHHAEAARRDPAHHVIAT